MITLTMRVNGKERCIEISPSTMLLDVLRDDLHLTGVKEGCGVGECGACTVLLDGIPVASCITPALKAQGRDVFTIESLSENGALLHPLQKAFLVEGAVQCGFCTPGMILAGKALLDKNSSPSEEDIRKELSGHLCRCTGYNPVIKAVQRAGRVLRGEESINLEYSPDMDAIGQSMVRLDGISKVTGDFKFGADLEAANILFAVPLFSLHPYAEIASMDFSEAVRIPGIVKILTAKDIPGRNAQGVIIPDQPVIVAEGEKVRCIGDILALVIAENEVIAREAVNKIHVEYSLLEGVYNARDALSPGAPILHPPQPEMEPSNIMYGTHLVKGDINAGFQLADLILERKYHTPFAEHAYLEPEAGMADVDDNGIVRVWMASQAITIHSYIVASILGVAPDRVRLIHVPPGGSFGSRNDMSLHAYLALAAYHTQGPIKMVFTRAESLRFHSKRHPMDHTVKIGAKRDGLIVALSCEILADTGAYSSAGIPVLDQATIFAPGPYEIPNIEINGLSVYTNNIPCGAMRGFGIPQSAYAIETILDELACELNIDPFGIRRLNALQAGKTTATGQVLRDSVTLVKTLDAVEQSLKKSLLEIPAPREGVQRGYGIASSYKNVGIGLGLPETTGIIIELTTEGKVLIKFGGAELGQGSDTTISQIASKALNLPPSLIDVLSCDTGLTPDGGITSASRTTFMSGNAVLAAAPIFLSRLYEKIGYDKVNKETLLHLAESLHKSGHTLSIQYTYNPLSTYPLSNPSLEAQTKFITFSYATQAAIVDVDLKTGDVVVLKMIAAHDIGKAINPLGALGQIEGSCIMGMGYAISEEFILDQGYMITDTLAKIGIPNMSHTPDVEVILIEEPDPSGPFGAKGIAEAAAVPSAPAIINAIHSATGIRIYQLPATPDRIYGALINHNVCPPL